MAGILSINKEGELVINKEAVKLCPVLGTLKEDEVKYIATVYDYVNSPWYMKPFEERQLIAKRRYYNEKSNPEKHDHIKLAIEEYESLIFNETLYQKEQYKKKLIRLNKLLEATDSPLEIKNLDASITIIMKRIDELESISKKETETLQLKGGKKLSLIEEFKRNKKMHELYKMQEPPSKTQ